jgi:thioredoxin-like negative regulator of GroEL
MNLEVQTAALVIAGAAAGLTAVAARMTAWHSRRRAVGEVGTPASEPYILYFTTADCSTCRLQQEPALNQLEGEARVEKVDAVERGDLADKYAVFTVPTTVVVAPDGRALAVNYGFAPAAKLRRQLADVAKAAA